MKTFQPRDLFPNQPEPEAPLAGLYLYFSCFEESHQLAQDCQTAEGKLWHAILHRQEPDSANAAYWFQKVGPHPTYSPVAQAAVEVLNRMPAAEFRAAQWDPSAFIRFCERAREQPGSVDMQAALEIQCAEWQILFDYSARLFP